jgi:hypothetical protein
MSDKQVRALAERRGYWRASFISVRCNVMQHHRPFVVPPSAPYASRHQRPSESSERRI